MNITKNFLLNLNNLKKQNLFLKLSKNLFKIGVKLIQQNFLILKQV